MHNPTKMLVVVDYQNDFVDGALGFAGAEQLDPVIAGLIRAYRYFSSCLDIVFELWKNQTVETAPITKQMLDQSTPGNFPLKSWMLLDNLPDSRKWVY